MKSTCIFLDEYTCNSNIDGLESSLKRLCNYNRKFSIRCTYITMDPEMCLSQNVSELSLRRKTYQYDLEDDK
jgi:hypothetical protein